MQSHWRAKKSLKHTIRLYALTPVADGTKVVIRTELAAVDSQPADLPAGIRSPTATFYDNVAEFGDLRFLESSGRASFFPVYYAVYLGGRVINAQSATPIKISVDGPRLRRDRLPGAKRHKASMAEVASKPKEIKFNQPTHLTIPDPVAKGGASCRSCRGARCGKCSRCNGHCRCSPDTPQSLSSKLYSAGSELPASPTGSELSGTPSPLNSSLGFHSGLSSLDTSPVLPTFGMFQQQAAPVPAPAVSTEVRLTGVAPFSGRPGDVCTVSFEFAAVPAGSSVGFGVVFGALTPDFLPNMLITSTTAQVSFIVPYLPEPCVSIVGYMQIDGAPAIQAANALAFSYLPPLEPTQQLQQSQFLAQFVTYNQQQQPLSDDDDDDDFEDDD